MKVSSLVCGACAALLLWSAALPAAAETTAAEGDARVAEPIVLATEPEEIDGKVYYYDGNKKVDPTEFTWVTGHTGQAVQLNGSTQYLRYSSAQVLKLEEMTFSAWINWAGDTADTVGQRLLTVYRNENRFITVSPHAQDAERRLDGVYAEWQDRSIEPITLFKPTDGTTTYALESGAWHHVAVVIAPTELTVYIDGAPQYTANLSAEPVDLQEMKLNTLLVGGGMNGEPTLAALLDDAYLYPQALTAGDIALLAAGLDPADGGTAPTSTAYLATRPQTTAASGTAVRRDGGVPTVLVVIPVAVIAAAVVLSLVFSKKDRRTAEDEDAAPLIVAGDAPVPPGEDDDMADEQDTADEVIEMIETDEADPATADADDAKEEQE